MKKASSGDRKTPGIRNTLRALDLIEKNNAGAVSKARLAHETRIQKSKEAAKRWKEEQLERWQLLRGQSNDCP